MKLVDFLMLSIFDFFYNNFFGFIFFFDFYNVIVFEGNLGLCGVLFLWVCFDMGIGSLSFLYYCKGGVFNLLVWLVGVLFLVVMMVFFVGICCFICKY